MLKTIWIFPVYYFLLALLIIFNVIVLQAGDPKFPSNLHTALTIYLPIWSIVSIPNILAVWSILTFKIPLVAIKPKVIVWFTVAILLALEVSFLLDLKLKGMVIEWALLIAALLLVRNRILTFK